jgi:hypothetical protein
MSAAIQGARTLWVSAHNQRALLIYHLITGWTR